MKAIHVKNIDTNAPHIHNLSKIAKEAGLELTEEQKDFLDEVSTFNIKARYPDYKGRFYKKSSKKFAAHYVEEIKEFRKWLIKKIRK